MSRVSVMRGPALCSMFKSIDSNVPDYTVYESDALIILEDNKITEYGPAANLYKKLPKGAQVTQQNKCRIIKTIIEP